MWRAIEAMRRVPLWDELRARQLQGESLTLTSAKLKLVDGCNLRCFMCDYWQGRREGELSTEEVLRVLAELAELGCQKVHFTGGEIFMRRDALELFARANELGMRVNLTTNGTLLDKAKLRGLLELPVRSITLSLDSPARKLHDQVRGRDGAFKKTLASLRWLAAHRKRKTRLRLNTVVSARTYRSLVELPDLLEGIALDGLLLIPMDVKPAAPDVDGQARNGKAPPAGPGRFPIVRPTPFAMTAEDVGRFNAEVAPVLAERLSVPGFDAYPFGRSPEAIAASAAGAYAKGHYVANPCHVPWFHTLVNATGEVYPCCMGHRNLPALGNVRSESLVEIFRGPRYRAFRRDMLRERPAVCHRCDDFLAENAAFDALIREKASQPG